MTDFDPGTYRAELPILDRLLPLNHCSQAPPSRRTLSAADVYLSSWSDRGMDWEAWVGEVNAARATFARLIGADPEDVAVGSSVSQVASSLASAIGFTGDRRDVVVDAGEFPTVSHVWSAAGTWGARLRRVDLGDDGGPVDAERLGLDERTKLVSVSQGCYADGTLRDLRGLAAEVHASGALLFVDAYQAAGTVPIDVHQLGVDALASGCLKYLLGIPGLAFLYVRKDLADRLEPGMTGWFGRREPFAFDPTLDWADGAVRFDLGTPPIFESYVCRAGMEWLLEVGIDRIRDWTVKLAGRMLDGCLERGLDVAGPTDAARRTPMVAVRVDDAVTVEAGLATRGIVASARGPVIRFAPHFYNTFEDVDRALDELVRIVSP